MHHVLKTVTLGALAGVLALGCGGGKSGSDSLVHKSFTGTLGDGSVVDLTFGDLTSASLSLRTSPRTAAVTSGAVIEITGSVAVPGTGVVASLDGFYDPSTHALEVWGGAYVLTATYANGALSGTADVGGTTVTFVAALGSSDTVTRYCGTFTTALGETGAFNLVVSGGHVYGAASGGILLTGTQSGSTLSLSADGEPVTGTVAGGTVSGTFTTTDGLGTWSGSTAACAGPVVACPAFDQLGAVVQRQYAAGTEPTPQGGTPAAGTYVLTAANVYNQSGTGATGETDQITMVIGADGAVQIVETMIAGESRFSATSTVVDSALVLTVVCSNPPGMVGAQIPLPFTATANELRFYDADDELVFTRQSL